MAKYLGRISHSEDIANKQYVDDQVQIALTAKDDVNEDVQAHISNTSNPHKVTKSQVGLGNVDNTSDANKPVSTAVKSALDGKADKSQVLTNVPAGAKFTDTVYTHPETHPSSMIIESSLRRFVTDVDKERWNSKTDDTTANTHIAKKDNPHGVTKVQVGLGSVDNVKQATKAEFDTHNADTTKHITKAERDAWNAKQGNLTAGVNVTIAEGTISAVDTVYDDSDVQSHIASKVNPHGVTKAQVGLGNVSNVAQASKAEFDSHNSDTTKHITASERTAWNNKQNALGFTPENVSNKGKAGGYASLDSGGKVPASELPSYVDDVVEGTALANLPTTGETGKIYVTTGDNKTYRWSGTGYVEISASLALGTTSSTAYRGDLGNTAYVHSQATGNPHGTTKAQVGLGNVDNTSDANKPVSTAMQSALNNKADKSQVLTNVPANAEFTDTVYIHPSTHPATMITESSTKRFVTDAEKSTWNAKQNALTAGTNVTISDNTISAVNTTYGVATTSANGLMASADKTKLNGIATGANNYTHPSSHPASMITESSTKRFVTDTEKNNWNDKWNYNENTIKAVKVNNASNADTVGGRSASDFASLEGVSKSWKIGNITNNVARCLFTGTPTEILIKTKIPFKSGTHMPVIHIQGYAYGLQSPVELKIGYYIYDDKHGYCGAVSMGAWQPEIKLFSYIGDDKKKYTGVALLGSIYFPQFSVGVQIEHGHDYERDWTITSNMSNNTVYHMPNSDVVNVPYKSTFSSKINGVTFNGLSDITITANPNPHTHDERYYTKAQTDTQLNGKVDNSRVLTNVPANAKFTDTNTTYSVASTTANGLMASGDKVKLNGIATGATTDATANAHIAKKDNPHSVTKAQVGLGSVSNVLQASKTEFDSHVGDATHVTSTEKETWNGKQNSLTAGANITISGNTISAVNTNTTYSVATTSANGLMSSADKVKLNGIATGANNYTHPTSHPASIITQNSSNRFVTDAQISSWDAKPSNLDTITNQRTGSQLKYWVGTQAQYDAIGTKDSNTIYDIIQVV